MPLPFSEDEDRWIKELYEHIPLETLMDYLPGRSPESIRIKARKMGFYKNKRVKAISWTMEEDLYLTEAYPKNVDIKILQQNLRNRSQDAIRLRAGLLGVKRNGK
jgi:hypothetical protein